MKKTFDEVLNELLETPTSVKGTEIPTYMLVAGVLVERAKQGDANATRLIIERLAKYQQKNF